VGCLDKFSIVSNIIHKDITLSIATVRRKIWDCIPGRGKETFLKSPDLFVTYREE
jgi:hypothetical protein